MGFQARQVSRLPSLSSPHPPHSAPGRSPVSWSTCALSHTLSLAQTTWHGGLPLASPQGTSWVEMHKDDSENTATITMTQPTASSSCILPVFFPHHLSPGSIDTCPPFFDEPAFSLMLRELPSYRFREEQKLVSRQHQSRGVLQEPKGGLCFAPSANELTVICGPWAKGEAAGSSHYGASNTQKWPKRSSLVLRRI